MTAPVLLLIVFALTWLGMQFIDWTLSPTSNQRVSLTIILLILFGAWVFGLQLIKV